MKFKTLPFYQLSTIHVSVGEILVDQYSLGEKDSIRDNKSPRGRGL
ncbi:MAG TPA: hypothetical protein VGG14_18175 [Candidatus Sulfotelmatobacter sp.]